MLIFNNLLLLIQGFQKNVCLAFMIFSKLTKINCTNLNFNSKYSSFIYIPKLIKSYHIICQKYLILPLKVFLFYII